MSNDKKYRYELCCEEWSEEGISCPCYGLVCEEVTIHYISTDREFVEQLASELNRINADPETAKEIVEDKLP